MPANDLGQIQDPAPDDDSEGSIARLELERKTLEVAKLRDEQNLLLGDRTHRLYLTYGLSIVGVLWLVGVFTLVTLHGVFGTPAEGADATFSLPTAVLVALVGTPGASFVGIAILSARAIFLTSESADKS
jgi:hypothetical protein